MSKEQVDDLPFMPSGEIAEPYITDGLEQLEQLANNRQLDAAPVLGMTTLEVLAQEIPEEPVIIRAGKTNKPEKSTHRTHLGGDRYKQDTD